MRLYGGERGIRTLETLLTLTHFPGVLLQPLGHLTVNCYRFLSFKLDRSTACSLLRCMLKHASRLCETAPWASKIPCILSATRTPHRKLLPFSILQAGQEHGVLIASMHAEACLSSLRDRPAGVQNTLYFVSHSDTSIQRWFYTL